METDRISKKSSAGRIKMSTSLLGLVAGNASVYAVFIVTWFVPFSVSRRSEIDPQCICHSLLSNLTWQWGFDFELSSVNRQWGHYALAEQWFIQKLLFKRINWKSFIDLWWMRPSLFPKVSGKKGWMCLRGTFATTVFDYVSLSYVVMQAPCNWNTRRAPQVVLKRRPWNDCHAWYESRLSLWLAVVTGRKPS